MDDGDPKVTRLSRWSTGDFIASCVRFTSLRPSCILVLCAAIAYFVSRTVFVMEAVAVYPARVSQT